MRLPLAQKPATTRVGANSWLKVATVILAALIFCAYAIYILNMFYGTGAYFLDAGWYAFVMSKFSFPPENPPAFGNVSFFNMHVSPLLPIWGFFAELAGTPSPVAMALYQGFFHALLFLTGAGLADTKLPYPWDRVFRLFVGGALVFSPITLEALTYPHIELAIPILFLCTCYALSRRQIFLAGSAFLAMLLVREDAGFHAFLFLSAFCAGEFLAEWEVTRTMKVVFWFAIAGALYSALAFTTKQIFFSKFDTFASSYAGTNFSHVSFALYQERLWHWLQYRPELFVILFLVLVWGWD